MARDIQTSEQGFFYNKGCTSYLFKIVAIINVFNTLFSILYD